MLNAATSDMPSKPVRYPRLSLRVACFLKCGCSKFRTRRSALGAASIPRACQFARSERMSKCKRSASILSPLGAMILLRVDPPWRLGIRTTGSDPPQLADALGALIIHAVADHLEGRGACSRRIILSFESVTAMGDLRVIRTQDSATLQSAVGPRQR